MYILFIMVSELLSEIELETTPVLCPMWVVLGLCLSHRRVRVKKSKSYLIRHETESRTPALVYSVWVVLSLSLSTNEKSGEVNRIWSGQGNWSGRRRRTLLIAVVEEVQKKTLASYNALRKGIALTLGIFYLIYLLRK